ncbi:unnamed protein product [Vitrella brassicaformis CCMP3155]|uniref:1-phosphatidylinositol 4-kinase n=2 Tax=Vitrella brassicaformis TaxID=1169539 RepID=A0A0G4FNI2_VITBC|nr:unnamed protein product [Vitrella brassicaformis CCMP3155]|eukprot:CEM15088.1 unnamed protein product [Vitrella brassicaformis CCMP3155]
MMSRAPPFYLSGVPHTSSAAHSSASAAPRSSDNASNYPSSLVGSCFVCCAFRDKDDGTQQDQQGHVLMHQHTDPFVRWRDKWKGVFDRLLKRPETGVEAEVFQILAGILAGEAVTEQLYSIYQRKRSVVALFVPEIANYLLHGAEPNRSHLEQVILTLSSHDLQLAHQFWWYLQGSMMPPVLVEGQLTQPKPHARVELLKRAFEEAGKEAVSGGKRPAKREITAQDDSSEKADDGASIDKSQLMHRFRKTPDFIDGLANISRNLVAIKRRDLRKEELQRQLGILNEMLPADVYIPVLNRQKGESESFVAHTVLHIPVEEAFCLHSKDRAPFHVCVEVLETDMDDDNEWDTREANKTESVFELMKKSFTPMHNAYSRRDSYTHTHDWQHKAPTHHNHPHAHPSMRHSAPLPPLSPSADHQAAASASGNSAHEHEGSDAHSCAYHGAAGVDEKSEGRAAAGEPKGGGGGSDGAELFIDPAVGSLIVSQMPEEQKQHGEHSPFPPPGRARMPSTHSHVYSHTQPATPYVNDDTNRRERTITEEETRGWNPPIVSHNVSMAASAVRSSDRLEGDDDDDNFELTQEELQFFERVKQKGGARGIFGQVTWEQVQERVRKASKFGGERGWRLVSVIVKTNCELRQEQLAAQLLGWFQRVWSRAKLKLWLKPFHVLSTSYDAGLIETIPDAISIDSLKKTFPGFVSIKDYFERTYPHSRLLQKAKLNYVASMAAYSIACYILSIRDRHNGNILIDTEGHVIHVDFGFMLSNAPGNVRFEPPLFKLTNELLEVMEGPRSTLFRKFRARVVKGFLAVRREMDNLLGLIEMMMLGEENIALPCFASGHDAVIGGIREKIPEMMPELDFRQHIHNLIDASVDNWRSRWYDKYQRYFVGIM